MSTPTKQSSLDRLTEALTQHGWTFEVSEASFLVPDEDKDYSSRYSSRRRLGTKAVQGLHVRANNGVVDTDSRSLLGSARQTLDAYFLPDGKYVAKHTRGEYPVTMGASLKTLLDAIAKHGPSEVQRRRAARVEAREAEHANKIAQADQAVAEAQSALDVARPAAVDAFAMLRQRANVQEALDTLLATEAVQAYQAAQQRLQRAQHTAQYAREEYQRMEQRGWEY